MRKALIPGTFDPVTSGHLSLIETASTLFDSVTVCILINPEKTCLFDEETRLEALRIAVSEMKNVSVESYHGMTADKAAALGATIVRGIRNEKDAAYELNMAHFNKKRNGVTTLFLPAEPSLSEVSSTAVRQMLAEGKPIPKEILPTEVGIYLTAKYKKPFENKV